VTSLASRRDTWSLLVNDSTVLCLEYALEESGSMFRSRRSPNEMCL
jgi:hypothetical protein